MNNQGAEGRPATFYVLAEIFHGSFWKLLVYFFFTFNMFNLNFSILDIHIKCKRKKRKCQRKEMTWEPKKGVTILITTYIFSNSVSIFTVISKFFTEFLKPLPEGIVHVLSHLAFRFRGLVQSVQNKRKCSISGKGKNVGRNQNLGILESKSF